jgi:protein-S-isoprenylcysteine O-methyltransferase Ste14
MSATYDYGLWGLVAFHIGVFLLFGLGLLQPESRREWRSMGAFTAFVVALYTEMYGFPLTIYLLTAWLGRYPAAEPFAHAAGNLWATLLLGPWSAGLLMGVGGVLILVGAALVIGGWRSIHSATGLVTDGIYATIRHPQYAGIGITILGALIQWPTLLTLVMAPVLLASYARLARKEERELEARFGEAYRAYRERVPACMPVWERSVRA